MVSRIIGNLTVYSTALSGLPYHTHSTDKPGSPLHHSDVTYMSWCLRSLATWLFIQQLYYAIDKKALHYWPSFRGIHQSLVVSLHKGPLIWKLFLYYDIIMTSSSATTYQLGSLLLTTSIPAWIRNLISGKVWDEITYPFPNFTDWTIENWE